MEQLFPFGKPVKGKELIDRKDEVAAVVKNLIGGQSLTIASPRRLGKSSIIIEALKRLRRKGFLTAYIDLFEVASIREFAEKIIEGTLENETSRIRLAFQMLKKNLGDFLHQAQFKWLWKEHEFILSFGDPKANEGKLIEEALSFPEEFARKRKKKIIVAIDEFGEILNWNGSLLKKMRSKFQKQDLATYLFSGSQESLIKKLFKDKAEAFYGFSKVMGLGFLPEDDLNQYLLKTFKKGRVKIKDELVKTIAKKMQYHPHYTKIYAQSINDVVSNYKNVVTKKDLEEGYEKAFLYLKNELDKEWAELGKAPLQKRILKFLAQGQGALYSKNSFLNLDKSSIYLALREIEEKGIIKKVERGRYIFINPFFADYLKRMEAGELF